MSVEKMKKIWFFAHLFVISQAESMEQLGRNTGLVLEGGGMRGVFTSGVLDAFMKHELYFDYTVSVSAGACNGMSYMSRQPRRARYSNIGTYSTSVFPTRSCPSTTMPTSRTLAPSRW